MEVILGLDFTYRKFQPQYDNERRMIVRGRLYPKHRLPFSSRGLLLKFSFFETHDTYYRRDL